MIARALIIAALFALLLPAAAGQIPPDRPMTPAQKLSAPIAAVKLQSVSLSQALASLSEMSGLAIQPDWEALLAVGVGQDARVSVKGENMHLDKALDLTLASAAPSARLGWYLSSSVVHVTTQAAALRRERGFAAPLPAGGNGAAGAPGAVPPAPRSPGAAREFNFQNVGLKVVLEFLGDIAGVNIHVNWRAMEGSGIVPETPVDLQARGISVGRALDLVLDQLNAGRDRYAGVYYVVEEGVVHVATGSALNNTTRVQMFDISDLLMTVRNFQGPRVQIANTSNTGSGANNTGNNNQNQGIFAPVNQNAPALNRDDDRKKAADQLIEVIKSAIGDDMWAPNGKGSIRIFQDKLIISQTPLGFKLLETAFGGG